MQLTNYVFNHGYTAQQASKTLEFSLKVYFNPQMQYSNRIQRDWMIARPLIPDRTYGWQF